MPFMNAVLSIVFSFSHQFRKINQLHRSLADCIEKRCSNELLCSGIAITSV